MKMKKNYDSPQTNITNLRIQVSVQETSIHNDYGEEQYSKENLPQEDDMRWGDLW